MAAALVVHRVLKDCVQPLPNALHGPGDAIALAEVARAVVRPDAGQWSEQLESLDGDAEPGDVRAAWDEEIAERVKRVQNGSAVLHTDAEAEQRIRMILAR